ncbi:MAG: hypothetical protein LBF62_01230 [Tannerellaceae bacterium]|jgi:hypothetical protein|nr:hypothetical protein [Tannerellaceae bacterium]
MAAKLSLFIFIYPILFFPYYNYSYIWSTKVIKVMDNLGDWLYIVIIIAVGISSLFSSAKKKKQAGQTPRQPIQDTENKGGNTPEPKSFWELLEEMQGGGQMQEKTQTKKKPAKVSAPAYNSEEINAFKVTPASQPLDLINLSEEEAFALPADSLRNIDELKKAVIYSEILNHKY